MGSILSLSSFGMVRVLVRSNWVALEREIESTAGTLHDSLEPMLPPVENPTALLQQIFPDLCIVRADDVEQRCNPQISSVHRHTTGISDRSLYYIRLFDRQGNLLAYSANQPTPPPSQLNPEVWQTLQSQNGQRYRQFTTSLHTSHTHAPGKALHEHSSWGTLQVGRTLATFDGELRRLRWIFAAALLLTLTSVATASWWLSGLAMRPIYQSYQQQQQFTADVAHELRSPLASLLATVEAALRLPPDRVEQIPAILNTVERQSRRLSQLISDLLLLASLERDTTATTLQTCCLNDIVADLTEELAELAAAKNIHLHNQIPIDEIQTFGNESELYRLISNLTANAIQYTPPGGSVTVRLNRNGHIATIAVKDTGIGIPSTEQHRIFERFYRVNHDRSRISGGTGLGLAIAQAIAHRHRGQIDIQSAVKLGSTFMVKLPTIDISVARCAKPEEKAICNQK
jgi:two-component Ni(II)/redox sensor kinase NrsS